LTIESTDTEQQKRIPITKRIVDSIISIPLDETVIFVDFPLIL
jgi:hypothetical protein